MAGLLGVWWGKGGLGSKCILCPGPLGRVASLGPLADWVSGVHLPQWGGSHWESQHPWWKRKAGAYSSGFGIPQENY